MTYKLLTAMLALTLLVSCGEKAEKADQAASADQSKTTETTEATESSAVEPALDSLDQRLSYMVGSNVARQFKRDSVELDFDALRMGVDDALADKESRLSEELVQQTIAAMQERAQKRQQESQAKEEKAKTEAVEKNKAEGEAYLTANKAKEGVVITDSGLQYKELVAGDGPTPTAEDTVSVHYKGTLVDGTEFDSSYGRGEPATFPVTGVIPGWVEALQLMNVGDKWELAIPSNLAYGPGGTGGLIGPSATLVFEVELLDIVKSEQ